MATIERNLPKVVVPSLCRASALLTRAVQCGSSHTGRDAEAEKKSPVCFRRVWDRLALPTWRVAFREATLELYRLSEESEIGLIAGDVCSVQDEPDRGGRWK